MKYSVIVPLYNKERYIERTLKSIFAQSFDDYELIVVDDGSTDQSYSIAQKLMGTGVSNRSLVHQENSGVAAARNKGAALAKGDFICFLDSDDWWEPNFLKEIDTLTIHCPDAGLYGSSFYIVKNGIRRISPRRKWSAVWKYKRKQRGGSIWHYLKLKI